jgi:hypothetical protein
MVEIPKRPEPRSPYDQKNGEAATAALLTIWELHSPYCAPSGQARTPQMRHSSSSRERPETRDPVHPEYRDDLLDGPRSGGAALPHLWRVSSSVPAALRLSPDA